MSLQVALLCEGTYPQTRGGVSVWCDQLIAGLSEYQFHLYSISALRFEVPQWVLPPNVASVKSVPLWEQQRTSQEGSWPALDAAYDALLAAIFAPEVEVQAFLGALRAMFNALEPGEMQADNSQSSALSAAMTSRRSAERLYAAWQAQARPNSQQPRQDELLLQPSLADALTANVWLEHLLRPLACPPPQVDVCHAASNGLSPLLAFTSKWRYGTPFVLTEHGVYLRERYLELRRSTHSPAFKSFLMRLYALLSRAAYQMADLITPGSHYNERWEVQQGAPAARIQPVYNGINPAIFPLASIEPSEPSISWVGRIDPLKDLETLIRAFGVVKEALPTAKLRMFGSVPSGNEGYARHCQALLTQLQLDKSASFEGHAPSVVEAYHAGQMVALTSISEGFPYTLIEAMAAGRATVATDVGGVSEALGDTGLVVPSRDYAAVARASLKLLGNADLRGHLGAAARLRVLSQFTLESFLEVYRAIYPQARLLRQGIRSAV